jgi:hypothetical protein
MKSVFVVLFHHRHGVTIGIFDREVTESEAIDLEFPWKDCFDPKDERDKIEIRGWKNINTGMSDKIARLRQEKREISKILKTLDKRKSPR